VQAKRPCIKIAQEGPFAVDENSSPSIGRL
jgi:hypothetical protein